MRKVDPFLFDLDHALEVSSQGLLYNAIESGLEQLHALRLRLMSCASVAFVASISDSVLATSFSSDWIAEFGLVPSKIAFQSWISASMEGIRRICSVQGRRFKEIVLLPIQVVETLLDLLDDRLLASCLFSQPSRHLLPLRYDWECSALLLPQLLVNLLLSCLDDAALVRSRRRRNDKVRPRHL